jgi:dienelactone hydrolase
MRAGPANADSASCQGSDAPSLFSETRFSLQRDGYRLAASLEGKSVRWLSVSVFCILAGAAVAGAIPARAAGQGGAGRPSFELVSFDGDPASGAATLQAALYRPEGPGPFPAVVALHGCAGLWDKTGVPSDRHEDWGERLAKLGYVVVMPDSFGSRGATGSQCRDDDRVARASRERITDAVAALAYLQGLPYVKPDAVVLLGWSNGGNTVLNTVRPRAAPAGGAPDFRAAVAFYPGCRVSAENARWSTRLDLFLLIGEADDWTPAEPCRALAAAHPEHVTLKTYPGAYHDFDHPGLPVHVVKGLAFTGSGTGSAHTGTDPAARADAILRVPAWIAAHLK